MLSLPLQLLRTAATASPGGISRSSDPTARARRALVWEWRRRQGLRADDGSRLHWRTRDSAL